MKRYVMLNAQKSFYTILQAVFEIQQFSEGPSGNGPRLTEPTNFKKWTADNINDINEKIKKIPGFACKMSEKYEGEPFRVYEADLRYHLSARNT